MSIEDTTQPKSTQEASVANQHSEAVDLVPPQYREMPSEVVEELWQSKVFVDPEKNKIEKERRKMALETIQQQEVDRETKKEHQIQEAYKALPDKSKQEFINLQQTTSEIIANTVKGENALPLSMLRDEERFIVQKMQAAYDIARAEQAEKGIEHGAIQLQPERAIDQTILNNLINRLSLNGVQDSIKIINEQARIGQIDKLRAQMGILQEPATIEKHKNSKNANVLEELKKIIEKKPEKFKKGLQDFYDKFELEQDTTKIAEWYVGERYKQLRNADYKEPATYEDAWNLANSNDDLGHKFENDWIYRGIFPNKQNGERTATRGSLNIEVTPQSVSELDELIQRGIIKANYKFGNPGTSAAASERHDAVTIYFIEPPTEESTKALAELAQKYLRGNNLLGKKVSEGFFLSEIGSVKDSHVEAFVNNLQSSEPDIAKALSSYLRRRPPANGFGMSEAQYYAVKDTLKLYGYDLGYDENNGLTVEQSTTTVDGNNVGIISESSASVESPHIAKETRLQTMIEKVDHLSDGLEKLIDSGIKETVAIFNVMDISTSASCEGHENKTEHGYPAPWIEVEAPNEPKWRFENQRNIYQKIATKYGITPDKIVSADDEESWREAFSEEAWIEASQLCEKQGKTAEYIAWEQENKKLLLQTESLLQEFYDKREVPDEVRIIAERKGNGSFRVHNGGKYFIPNARKDRMAKELTIEEQERIPEVLKASQTEMSLFTAFLKSKYFESDTKELTPEQKKEKGLNDLRNVGPEKPLGYLPLDTLGEYMGDGVQKFQEDLAHKGLGLITLQDNESSIGSGALFVYDKNALTELIDKNKKIVEDAGWPTDPELFVRTVGKKQAPPKSDLFNLIADAFGDKSNPNRK